MMTQSEALEILKTGANVFLTGEPGSGKTHTINTFVDWLRDHGIEPAITASTGIAATHIGGMTIHAWSGIGVAKFLTEEGLDMLSQKEPLVRRIRNTTTLIIDEVSMLSAGMLTMVDQVLRALRHTERPFGGMQVILVGDFFQLPPVSGRDDYADREAHRYSFQAPVWKTLNPIPCYLSEQHRNEDAPFLEILNAIRKDSVTDAHKQTLIKQKKNGGGSGTELYAHNADVDTVNERYLLALPGNARMYEMTSSGRAVLIEAMKRGCLSPERLVLKVGAKVMCTKNAPEKGFMNGSTGTVVGFDSYSGNPLVKLTSGKTIEVEPMDWNIEDNGKILAQLKQIPLRLAWAITIHKSQGLSLDAATIDLSKVFEYGHGYVALSRLRTLDGLTLTGISERAFQVHPDVLAFDERFRDASTEARNAFSQMKSSDKEDLHARFVKASGGKDVAIKRTKEKAGPASRSTQWKATDTIDRVRSKIELKSIVDESKRTWGTIITHIEDGRKKEQLSQDDCAYLCEGIAQKDRIFEAIESHGTEKLKPVYEALNEEIPFEDIRIARLMYL
jgi:hypothetical protein